MSDGAFCHYCRRARCECPDYLRKIATEFRAGLLADTPSDLMCYVVTLPLSGLFRFMGYEAELIEGEVDLAGDDPGSHIAGHYWIRIGNQIIDPTADQFNRYGLRMPPVYIGKLPKEYRALVPEGQNRGSMNQAR